MLKTSPLSRITPWLLLAVIAPLCFGSAPARAEPEPSPNSPSLDDLNSLFLEGYKRRREQVRDATSPVLVVNFGTLELHYQGETKKEVGIPPVYHHLKSIAHVPLGLYARITYYRAAPNPSALRAEMETYRDKIQAVLPTLGSYGFTQKQLARQEKFSPPACKSPAKPPGGVTRTSCHWKNTPGNWGLSCCKTPMKPPPLKSTSPISA